MKKIFVVAGELSGDRTAAWYLGRRIAAGESLNITGVGGDNLQSIGARLFARFETLNCAGIVEIVRHLPRIIKILMQVAHHIITECYDELVLVDFPGFNMRLARMIRRVLPTIHMIYIAPPQLWIWGAWRVHALRRTCHQVVVLYPHEVSWYAQRGIHAEYYGYPWYLQLAPHRVARARKQNQIALIVGSRRSELDMLFECYRDILPALVAQDSRIQFVIPRADSIDLGTLERAIERNRLSRYRSHMVIISGPERAAALARCAFALTKQGTITLELALLGIPAILLFRTSRLSFYIGKWLVQVRSMALSNLLSGFPIVPEYIQHNCIPATIAVHAQEWYTWFCTGDARYDQLVADCLTVDKILRENI